MKKKTSPSSTDRKPSQPGAQHGLLDVFLGRWKMEGKQLEGPFGPDAEIKGVQSYEWLGGGFFMIQRFDALVDGNEAACIELVGYDVKSKTYPVQTFYSDGSISSWQMTESDGTWKLTGKSETGGKSSDVRCTTVFSDGGSAMKGKWEYSTDGTHWKTFWKVKASKVN